MKQKYIEDCTRMMSLTDVKAWEVGHSVELEKVIGVGMFKSMFVSKDGCVTTYCELMESWYVSIRILETLNEPNFFNNLCDDFLKMCKKAECNLTHEEAFNLSVKMYPALIIFDEIDSYPEIVSDKSMLFRLTDIRTGTQDVRYKLSDKLNHTDDKDYVYLNGKLFVTKQ